MRVASRLVAGSISFSVVAFAACGGGTDGGGGATLLDRSTTLDGSASAIDGSTFAVDSGSGTVSGHDGGASGQDGGQDSGPLPPTCTDGMSPTTKRRRRVVGAKHQVLASSRARSPAFRASLSTRGAAPAARRAP